MPGRNDLCHCGSGKKYKKCCLIADELRQEEYVKKKKEFVEENSGKFEPSPQGRNAHHSVENDDDNSHWDPELLDEEDDLPEISDQQREIVTQWNFEITGKIVRKDPVFVVEKIGDFLKKHPDLFPYLHLEDTLFTLDGIFSERKEWDQYYSLLREIRLQQPQVYNKEFQYFDFSLIVDAVASGKAETVPQFFSFFKEEPDRCIDKTCEIKNFLAANDCHDALLCFEQIVSGKKWPITADHYEEDDGYWIVFSEQAKSIDSDEAPATAADRIATFISQSYGKNIDEFEKEVIRKGIEIAKGEQTDWDISVYSTMEQLTDFYDALAWRFCVFLHREKNIGWIKARYIANKMLYYWNEIPNKKQLKQTFRIDEKLMEQFIARSCCRILHTDGVKAGAFLDGIYFLADFLEKKENQTEQSPENIRKIARNLYSKVIKTIDSLDPLHRIKPIFVASA